MIGHIEGDTRSLDYSSYQSQHLGFRVLVQGEMSSWLPQLRK